MRLFRDRRGSAAVEFALISVFLFGTMMVALDFGFYVQQRLKLGNVVEQATILAYNQKVTTGTAAIKSYVETYSGLKTAPVATITCNGTTCDGTTCSCITAAGGFTIAGSCNVSCGGGSNALSGRYLKVAATATYQSVIVPDKYLNNGTITQSAVIRMP